MAWIKSKKQLYFIYPFRYGGMRFTVYCGSGDKGRRLQQFFKSLNADRKRLVHRRLAAALKDQKR